MCFINFVRYHTPQYYTLQILQTMIDVSWPQFTEPEDDRLNPSFTAFYPTDFALSLKTFCSIQAYAGYVQKSWNSQRVRKERGESFLTGLSLTWHVNDSSF